MGYNTKIPYIFHSPQKYANSLVGRGSKFLIFTQIQGMSADWKPLKPSYSKGVFALVITFFAIQVAFDIAHSVTAFPFVHYGMFSERVSAPDSLLRYEVIVDGHRLNPADFRIYKWDMVQQPLAAFDRMTATDDFAFDKSTFRNTFPAFYAHVSDNLDNLSYPEARFPDWYANYLSALLGHSIHSVEVNRTWYRYESNRFILLNEIPWITR
jgi:hypothetical protein